MFKRLLITILFIPSSVFFVYFMFILLCLYLLCDLLYWIRTGNDSVRDYNFVIEQSKLYKFYIKLYPFTTDN